MSKTQGHRVVARAAVAALVVTAGLATANCGGACVAKGNRVPGELGAGTDLNHSGAGAQQTPFPI